MAHMQLPLCGQSSWWYRIHAMGHSPDGLSQMPSCSHPGGIPSLRAPSIAPHMLVTQGWQGWDWVGLGRS